MNSIQFGANKFCGPSVLSAVLGITTDEASAVLSKVTGRKIITSVWPLEVVKALQVYGYKSIKINPPASTLFGCLRSLTDGVYLFYVPGHVVAIEVNGIHRYICDNHTKSTLNAASSSRLMQRVDSIYMVEKVNNESNY
jgi:hypothetical protein